MKDIALKHLNLVKKILAETLPDDVTVWIFGSRARGTAKKFSDLDLLIDANGQPIASAIIADLREAFEYSDLPYKVDLVDWNTITESFRDTIKDQRVILPF